MDSAVISCHKIRIERLTEATRVNWSHPHLGVKERMPNLFPSFTWVLLAVSLYTLPFAESQTAARTPTSRVESSRLSATDFTGVDIGAQINAAFASCSGRCYVRVPQGDYTYSTTIRIPVAMQGGVTLECDSVSTKLRYIGSGDAVAALGVGESEPGILIRNCSLDGSAAGSGTNGLHLRAIGGGLFENIRVLNFSGDGILNEGVNSATYISPDIEANNINVHNVGVSVSGAGYSTNSVKIFGGILGYAKKWGVYEDSSQVEAAFPNGGNIYDGVNFEANGTDDVMSGNAFLQWCDGCVITNSYLEFFNSRHVPENVVIGGTAGDGVGGVTASPQGVKIVNNHMLSDNAVDSVLVLNGRMIIVEGNSEVGNPTNFVNMKGNVQWSFVGHNLALAATNPVVNSDTGNPPPGNPGIGGGTTVANANQPTDVGYAFNTLVGDTTDLNIRSRRGGADNLVGLDQNGNLIYRIYGNGIGKFPGLVVDNAGLTFNTPGSHILTVGGNNMITGTISMNNQLLATTQFGSSYNFPPNCTLTPRQNMRNINWWVTTKANSVSVTTSARFTGNFSYLCVGDAN